MREVLGSIPRTAQALLLNGERKDGEGRSAGLRIISLMTACTEFSFFRNPILIVDVFLEATGTMLVVNKQTLILLLNSLKHPTPKGPAEGL